jgi:glutamate mutase epsilon subunit
MLIGPGRSLVKISGDFVGVPLRIRVVRIGAFALRRDVVSMKGRYVKKRSSIENPG